MGGDYWGEDDERNRDAGWWQGLHPSVRSALIFCTLLLGVALLNAFTGVSIIICYPVQLLLYVGNGALAGSFALGAGYSATDLPRVGAIAGFAAWILPAIFYLVFGLLLVLQPYFTR